MTDTHLWTVSGSRGDHRLGDPGALLDALARAVDAHLPSAIEVHVTIRDPEHYCSALVPAGDGERPVDAALEVETAERCPPLDPFHARLREDWHAVQGWRVHPTLIHDSTRPRALGAPSRSPAMLLFLQRLDGTTAEHFSTQWYVHAGHLDGAEVESEASRAERRRDEAAGPDHLYRQHRVVEPLTPTAWVMDGYAQLQLGYAVPGMAPVTDGDPYPRVRGEEPFERWPPRILQGREYRVR